jgi:hypothetical protein
MLVDKLFSALLLRQWCQAVGGMKCICLWNLLLNGTISVSFQPPVTILLMMSTLCCFYMQAMWEQNNGKQAQIGGREERDAVWGTASPAQWNWADASLHVSLFFCFSSRGHLTPFCSQMFPVDPRVAPPVSLFPRFVLYDIAIFSFNRKLQFVSCFFWLLKVYSHLNLPCS